MRSLTVSLGARSYPIRIGSGLLGQPDPFPELRGKRVRVITDGNVAAHYLEAVLKALALEPAHALVLPAGEPTKSWDQLGHVIDWLLAQKLGRDGCVLALGGGVIGDLAGFACAITLRGIDFLQVPTTLLAQVDSSVGGKTGINHASGKNLIGAFHQPIAVVADLDTLRTLPKRELLAGLAEVIKYGMLADADFLRWLEQHLDRLLALDADTLGRAVHRCCELKAHIVAEDERESGPRALLNLGHTFGHAIETYTGYTQWLHGEAVAAGLCMAADLSARTGWISDDDAERCIRLVSRAGLPRRAPPGMTPADFLELMGHDKKVAAGRVRLVLLRQVGMAVMTADFDPVLLRKTLEAFTG